MSVKNSGGQAFPSFEESVGGNKLPVDGMSLRDYFAARAMSSLILQMREEAKTEDILKLSEVSFAIADAMLKEREK